MQTDYIKMCKEAPEIQEAWEPKRGDKYHFFGDPDVLLAHLNIPIVKARYSWLPRIEDLVEMVRSTEDTGVNIEARFHSWVFDGKMQRPTCPDYQVLWLCFVMYTVYNKSWNGETWA